MNATIAAFARAGGVGVETVHFYQRRQLLPMPSQARGVRRYGPEDLRRLRFIRAAQAAGFTLEQVGELLSLDAGEDRSRALALAEARVDALDARIDALCAARDALRRLARACAATDTGPCPILAAFELG